VALVGNPVEQPMDQTHRITAQTNDRLAGRTET
jgi:hypothetical protein